MKTSLVPSLGLALALGTTFTVPLRAALDPKIVPAGSQWIAYADFEALRNSEAGRLALERLPSIEGLQEMGPFQPNFAAILATLGTITAFGDRLDGDAENMDGAIVLQGKPELRTIAEAAVAQMLVAHPDEVQELAISSMEAYVGHKAVFVGFPQEPIVIIAHSQARLEEALQVFRGKAPALSGRTSKVAAIVPKVSGYYVMAASVVPSNLQGEQGNTPQARILQMTEAAAVTLGERGENLVLTARLSASSDDMATKLEKILRGVVALVSLSETNDADLTAFINALTVERSGNGIGLELAYPSAKAVAMIERQLQQQENRNRGPVGRESFDFDGQLADEWMASEPSDEAAGSSLFHSKPVALGSGRDLIITARRGGGDRAAIDYLELKPADGSGAPLRYEAEYLRLRHFNIRPDARASEGELIQLNSSQGSARLRFMGAAGNYVVTVAFRPDEDGEASYKLSVLDPKAAETESE